MIWDKILYAAKKVLSKAQFQEEIQQKLNFSKIKFSPGAVACTYTQIMGMLHASALNATIFFIPSFEIHFGEG